MLNTAHELDLELTKSVEQATKLAKETIAKRPDLREGSTRWGVQKERAGIFCNHLRSVITYNILSKAPNSSVLEALRLVFDKSNWKDLGVPDAKFYCRRPTELPSGELWTVDLKKIEEILSGTLSYKLEVDKMSSAYYTGTVSTEITDSTSNPIYNTEQSDEIKSLDNIIKNSQILVNNMNDVTPDVKQIAKKAEYMLEVIYG